MKKVQNSTIHFGVPTWTLLGLLITFPFLWFRFLPSFFRANSFDNMGISIDPIFYFILGLIFIAIIIGSLVLRFYKLRDFRNLLNIRNRINESKQRVIYAKLWGIPRGKLKGPIYLRVHSLDDFHNEESQRIYYYIDRKKNVEKLFFEVRVKACYAGKECEICEKKERDFFNTHHECIQRVVKHDEVFAEFGSVPRSFSRNSLKEFLKLDIV